MQETIQTYLKSFSNEKLEKFNKLPVQDKWEFIKTKGFLKSEFINYINSLLVEIPDEELCERKEKYGIRTSQ